MFGKLIIKLRSMQHYVLLDPRDNSVTLSRKLFQHIKGSSDSDALKVFVFSIAGDGAFGFVLDPGFENPTQLCEIQYNSKHRCVGFESLCPSVGRILYDYGLNADRSVALSVSIRKTQDGRTYYRIERPPKNLVREALEISRKSER